MKKLMLLTILILLIYSGYSFGDVPCKINYQGRLIKDNVPVHNTTGVPMTFTVDGIPVYTGDVPVYNGLFRVVLDLEGIDWTAGEELYLEVIVGGETLSPREQIYAYPYAINSHLLEGSTKEYFINVSGETQRKDGGLNIMGNVGIGTESPGAKLEVSGEALFAPTSQPTSPLPGMIYYDQTDDTMYYYKGGATMDWTPMGGESFGVWTTIDSSSNPIVRRIR